jgi:hypothetical protein
MLKDTYRGKLRPLLCTVPHCYLAWIPLRSQDIRLARDTTQLPPWHLPLFPKVESLDLVSTIPFENVFHT